MNFDFLGGQQQMSSQQPGVLQSLAHQQSGMGDAQLLQQQAMFKQMQEMQRQQQYIQAMQRNTMNQTSISSQATGNHTPSFVNGSPMHDASNYSWPSQAMIGNTNWLQRGDSPTVQRYSNGVTMSPEHGQSLPLMGLNPQQGSQSLYGVPISNARSAVGFLPNQLEKTGPHEFPVQRRFSGDQTRMFMEQVGLPEGTMLSRQGYGGRHSFEMSSGQVSGHTIGYETLNQMQQKALPEFKARQDGPVPAAFSLPAETVKQVPSSQPSAELDPTEQRLLFGGDDNIWEAFGETLNEGNGSLNNSDGAFPSINSGSWSALMQSAVAEASAGDTGQEREFHGAGIQSSESHNRNQQLLLSPDRGRQPVGKVDSSSMAPIRTRPFPEASSAHHHLGLEQTGTNQTRELWGNRSIQRSPGEENKLPGHNQPEVIAEGTHMGEQTYSSGNFNSRNPAGSWSHQQSIPSLANRSRGSSSIQSKPGDGDTVSGGQGKFIGSNSGINVNVGHDEGSSGLGPAPHSNLAMERHQINSRDDPRILNRRYQEFWKPVSSDVHFGADGLRKHQQYSKNGMQSLLNTSLNSSEHGAVDAPEAGKDDKRENSSDGYSSNLSNRASTGASRENVWVDAGNRLGVPGEKQNPSVQVVQESHGPRKFHYHPMGDVHLDTEHNYGARNIFQSRAASNDLAGGLRRNEDQSRILMPSTADTVHPEKGDIKLYGISSGGIGPGYVSSASASFHNSSVTSLTSNSAAPSQNMLELLQKVDRSKEHNEMVHLRSNDQDRSSSISQAEASDGEAGLSPKRSFSSQGFGLQLAPPSQGIPAPNLMASSCSLSQSICSPSSYDVSDKGDKEGVHMHETYSGDAQVGRSGIPGKIHANSPQNIQPNFPEPVTSGSMHLRSIFQNQQIARAGVQASHGSYDGQPSHEKQMNDEGRAGRSAQLSYFACAGSTPHVDSAGQRENFGSSEMRQKGRLLTAVPNRLSNVASVQQSLATQYATDMSKNQLQINNILDTSTSAQQTKGGQDMLLNRDAVQSQDSVGGLEQSVSKIQIGTSGKTSSELQEIESSAINPSVPSSATSEKDIEDFGRSLKPDAILADKYSLLHQMQAMRGMDPSSQPLKRFKGMDDGAGNEQIVGKPNHTTISQDSSFGKVEPQNSSGGEVEMHEHSRVSLQMAPTWFEQHGSFKNRQLTVHDAQKASPVGNPGQQFMAAKSLKDFGPGNALVQGKGIIDTGHVASFWQTTAFAQSEGLSSRHPLTPSVATASAMSLKSKKRKIATPELIPWHKEVTLCSQQLHDMSLAEEEWAKAARCLIEKVKDEIHMHEDVSPVIRSRRRLILTMKLMQHIFRPPPATVLSLDANTEFETVVYNTARLALGDACNLLCQSENNSCMSWDEENLRPKEQRNSGRTGNQGQRKRQVEDFMNKARSLEADLQRLDNRLSVLDLRLDCQDLERFSIINRFAKFHGRGQVEGAETTSSPSATVAAHRVYPQRYVNANPAPKNLPERVQCLSL